MDQDTIIKVLLDSVATSLLLYLVCVVDLIYPMCVAVAAEI